MRTLSRSGRYSGGQFGTAQHDGLGTTPAEGFDQSLKIIAGAAAKHAARQFVEDDAVDFDPVV
jgi:hypothetical protein